LNSMLPAPREMPPHRQAQIREELQRVVAGERRRVRYAPVITAFGALAALVLVAMFVPWQSRSTPASAPTSAVGTPVPSAPHTGTRPAPVIPGLSTEERTAIEKGCGMTASQSGPVQLYNLVTDAGGRFALLYSASAALDCAIGGAIPYNSGFAGTRDMAWIPGPLSVDVTSASAGGDAPGGKSMYHGEHGFEVSAGRVSDKVTKVTYTQGGQTVTATLANGTFVARIVHPATWKIPSTPNPGIVRAYDTAGTLLATAGQDSSCYVTPDGHVLPVLRESPDPKTCKPTTHWPS
jgi:hypothetical protein